MICYLLFHAFSFQILDEIIIIRIYYLFILCIIIKSLIIMNINKYALIWQILTFEYNQEWKWSSIDINILDYYDSFLTFRLCLKCLTNCSINNMLWDFDIINCKLIFIYIIQISWFNIIFIDNFPNHLVNHFMNIFLILATSINFLLAFSSWEW